MRSNVVRVPCIRRLICNFICCSRFVGRSYSGTKHAVTIPRLHWGRTVVVGTNVSENQAIGHLPYEQLASVLQYRSIPGIYSGVRHYAKKAIVKETKKGSKPKVHLSDEEILEVVDIHVYRNKLQQIVDKLKSDYNQYLSIHRGSSQLERLEVEYEGDKYELNQLGVLSFKNPHVIVVNMANFPECIKAVIQAIQTSGMNVTAQQDGTVVYVHLPKVTREHREALAKNAKAMFNKAKDDISNVLQRFSKEARKSEEYKSKDLVFNVQEHLKATASDYSTMAEKMMKEKQKDLLGEK